MYLFQRVCDTSKAPNDQIAIVQLLICKLYCICDIHFSKALWELDMADVGFKNYFERPMDYNAVSNLEANFLENIVYFSRLSI